jgi:predicted DNA-binding ribbon-helix-helix protein
MMINTARSLARKTLVQGTEDPAEIKKRSVVISGHRTSISLENVFWESLRDIASAKGRSVNQLVTDIDRQRTGNLSSAIRTYVLLDAVSD